MADRQCRMAAPALALVPKRQLPPEVAARGIQAARHAVPAGSHVGGPRVARRLLTCFGAELRARLGADPNTTPPP